MKVKLKNVLPNPFRNMEHYPIDTQKVLALKKSIEDTTFWDNIVARKLGDKVEIAYGHHRLTALRELYDDEHEISIITRDIDDAQMLKIMANENMQEWSHLSDVERETVRAVVQAFADNRITLPKPDSKTKLANVRVAPSFNYGCASLGDAHAYTSDVIAGFLGWGSTNVRYILRALGLIEDGVLSDKKLAGLTTKQSQTVVDEVGKAQRQAKVVKAEFKTDADKAPTERKAKFIEKSADEIAGAMVANTVNSVTGAFKTGESVSTAKSNAMTARAKANPKDKALPEIGTAMYSLGTSLSKYLAKGSATSDKLDTIISNKQHATENERMLLGDALAELSEMALAFKNKLER